MLNIYVFSQGTTAFHVFEALATFLGNPQQDGFSDIFAIAAVFAVAGATFMYIRSHDIMVFVRWVAIYFICSTIMVGSTATVAINDVSNPAFIPRVVDNVPLGVALPAWIFSTLEMGLTKSFESIFHTPGDVEYSSTGMIYGARLFHSANKASYIQSAATQSEFNHFLSQCIVPDVLINKKYTFGELKKAPDIFTFLSSHSMSPLRGIYINGAFQICKKALPILQKAVTAQLDAQVGVLGRLLGVKNPTPGKILSQVQNVYDYTMGMSQSASQILIQNTMTNALRSGIGTMFANNSAPAALINYGYTSAMQKQLISDNVVQRFGSYMVPLMQTMFFMLLVALFPVMVLLMLQPSLFLNTLKHYIMAFATIATWPVMYTVINYFMTTSLAAHMTGIFGETQGLTLSNQNALLYQAEMFAAECGYYLAAIPVLSVFIFRGLDSALMYGSQALFGNMQQSVGESVSGLSKGDINLGNSSVDNHSWNNVGANKWDTNTSIASGMMTMQQLNGSTVTHTPSGQDIYNTQGGMSNTAVSANLGQSISSNLSMQASNARSQAMASQDSFNQSISNASNTAYNWGQSHGTSEGYGTGASLDTASSSSEALSNMHSLATDLSKATGISENQAYDDLTRLSADASVKFDSSKSLEGKLLSMATGINASVGATGTAQSTSSHTDQSTERLDKSSLDKMVSDYRSNLDYLTTNRSNLHTEAGHNESDSIGSSIGDDLRNAQTASQHYSADMSWSESLNQMASFARQDSASIGENYTQEFVDYVREVDPQNANAILSNTSNPQLLEAQSRLAQDFISDHAGSIEQGIHEKMDTLYDKNYYSKGADIVNDKAGNIQSNFDHNADHLKHETQNLTFDQHKADHIKEEVGHAHASAEHSISQGKAHQDSTFDANNQRYEKGLTTGRHAAERGATMGALHSFMRGHQGIQTSFVSHDGKVLEPPKIAKKGDKI